MIHVVLTSVFIFAGGETVVMKDAFAPNSIPYLNSKILHASFFSSIYILLVISMDGLNCYATVMVSRLRNWEMK